MPDQGHHCDYSERFLNRHDFRREVRTRHRYRRGIPVCVGLVNVYMQWKCYVRQAVVAQRGTGVRERAKGGIAPPLCNPRSRPATLPLRGALASISSLQVGRDTASCLSRPQPHIPVGLTWLVNYASAMLIPDTTPRLTFLCFH